MQANGTFLLQIFAVF